MRTIKAILFLLLTMTELNACVSSPKSGMAKPLVYKFRVTALASETELKELKNELVFKLKKDFSLERLGNNYVASIGRQKDALNFVPFERALTESFLVCGWCQSEIGCGHSYLRSPRPGCEDEFAL
ncbi:MAG: hypothetical protein H7301_13235 [Cryobacterium sp.]|nr:hypothetical protein [Oligoflexia bacterium]